MQPAKGMWPICLCLLLAVFATAHATGDQQAGQLDGAHAGSVTASATPRGTSSEWLHTRGVRRWSITQSHAQAQLQHAAALQQPLVQAQDGLQTQHQQHPQQRHQQHSSTPSRRLLAPRSVLAADASSSTQGADKQQASDQNRQRPNWGYGPYGGGGGYSGGGGNSNRGRQGNSGGSSAWQSAVSGWNSWGGRR